MANQYRYSQHSFQRSVITAVGLTLIVSFLVWLFSRLLGLAYTNTISLVSGAIFFSFCSAAMILRYMRKDVVVAVRPDGLFDARYSSQAVPWDEIKDVRLGRAENDFVLDVTLWPDSKKEQVAPRRFNIDLAPLDAPVGQILQALSAYKPIYMDNA